MVDGAPEGSGEVIESGGQEAKVTFHTPTDEQTFPSWKDNIPTEHAEKTWLGEIPDHQTAVKMLIDQKTALSQRPAGIPQDNASEEEIASFNKALGVPEKAEDYQFADLEEGQERNEAFEKGIRGLFKNSNITGKQATALESGFNELVKEMTANSGVDTEQQNVDFDKLAADTFGDNEEKVMSQARGLLAEHIPESMKSHLESLSNENLVIMAGVLDSIAKAHISEDRLPDFKDPMAGMNPEDKIAEGTRLMNTPAFEDVWHPDHASTNIKVQKCFGTFQG